MKYSSNSVKTRISIANVFVIGACGYCGVTCTRCSNQFAAPANEWFRSFVNNSCVCISSESVRIPGRPYDLNRPCLHHLQGLVTERKNTHSKPCGERINRTIQKS